MDRGIFYWPNLSGKHGCLNNNNNNKKKKSNFLFQYLQISPVAVLSGTVLTNPQTLSSFSRISIFIMKLERLGPHNLIHSNGKMYFLLPWANVINPFCKLKMWQRYFPSQVFIARSIICN